MPVEIIGEAGTSGAAREWIPAECRLAIKHLKRVCGQPPPEMELEVQWQEHELREYPTMVLTWEDAMRGAPWEYLEKCEKAFAGYEKWTKGMGFEKKTAEVRSMRRRSW